MTATLPEPRRFVDVTEVARLAQVSRMTIYRAVQRQEIPSVKVGRQFRIPIQYVRDWLNLPDLV